MYILPFMLIERLRFRQLLQDTFLFNIVEHSRHYLKARIPRTEKDDTTVEEFVKSNNSRGTELQLKT